MEAMERRGVLAKARAFDALLAECAERDEWVREEYAWDTHPGNVHVAMISTKEIREILAETRNH